MVISIISVAYMAMTCLNYLLDFQNTVKKAYANVYDIMFNFFRNGNKQMLQLMKIELDKRIMDPFYTKLDAIRMMLEDITFALQVAFFVAIMIGIIVFIVSQINLLWDYKTRILEARRGIFRDFHFDKLEIVEGPQLPGFIIANSIAGFALTVFCCTIILTFIFWPLFWVWLWQIKFFLLSIIIPAIIKFCIEGWIESFVYERYYIKNRCFAGALDIVYFFLAILEGIGEAILRFRNGFLAFLICQTRLNVPCLPDWILKISFLDKFYRSYVAFIYLQHAHNNPTVLWAAQTLVDIVNGKKRKRLELIKKYQQQKHDKDHIPEEGERSFNIDDVTIPK